MFSFSLINTFLIQRPQAKLAFLSHVQAYFHWPLMRESNYHPFLDTNAPHFPGWACYTTSHAIHISNITHSTTRGTYLCLYHLRLCHQVHQLHRLRSSNTCVWLYHFSSAFFSNYATYTSLPSMVLILVYTGYGNFTIFFIYTSLKQQIISISPQTMVYTTYITLIQPALYHPTYTIHTSITHSIPLIAFIYTIYIIPVKTTSTQPTLYILLLRNLYHIHYVYHQYQPYH